MGRKRSASGQGSIRQRSDGRWEARITTGYDPLTGKQITRSVYGKSQAEVRQKLTAISADLDKREYVAPTKYTLGEWLDVWLTNYCGNLKFCTIRAYEVACRQHIKPLLGKIRLSDITPVDCQMFINRCSTKKCGGNKSQQKTLSPSTLQSIHATLSKSLAVAVSQGLIRNNPAARTVIPKAPTADVNTLTDAQVSAFLKACDTDEYGDILKIILFLGLRESEAAGLCWNDINFRQNTVTVSRQLQFRNAANGGYVYSSPKNGKSRVLSAPPFVMSILKDRQNRQILDRLAAAEAWQGWQSPKEMETAPVFTRPDGRHISIDTLYKHFKQLAAQIGAPEARLHDLRHTYAVLSLQNGDDAKTLSSNLGHASVAFTLDTYAHATDRLKQEAADRMQRYFESIG